MGPTISFIAAALLTAQTPEPPTSAPAGKTCSCQKNAVTPVQYIQPVVADEPAPATGIRSWFSRDTSSTPPPAPTPAPTTTPNRPVLSWFQRTFGKSDDAAQTTTVEPAKITTTIAPAQRLPQGNALPQSNALPAATPSLSIPASPPQALPAAPAKIITPINYPSTNNQPASTVTTPAFPVSSTTSNSSPINAATLPASRASRISPELITKVGHAEDYSWITGQIRIENGQHVIHYAPPEVVDRFNGSLVLTSDRDLRAYPDGSHVCVRGQIAQNGRTTTFRVQNIDVLPR